MKTLSLLFLLLSPSCCTYALTEEDVPGEAEKPTEEFHQDSRCVCKCPDVAIVVKDSKEIVVDVGGSSVRSVYINSSVTPHECTCENIVLSRLNLTVAEADSFCPRCRCTFQSRNLTVMKVVVILVIWVILILTFYMAFLTCLEPILNKRLAGIRYRQQLNSIGGDSDTDDSSTQLATYGSSVMNRVGDRQTKWKVRVVEQRRNIYDRRAMLN